MRYEVVVVGDQELPEGITRLIVERTGGDALLLLAESAAGTWKFMRRWEESHEQPARVFELRPAG